MTVARRSREPAQKPGRSRQDFETPPEFIAAVERRFGFITLDLAATSSNAKAGRFITPEEDSLSEGCDWSAILREQGAGAFAWLNPPFANLAPWADKCRVQGAMCKELPNQPSISLLVPASVGANWFRYNVDQYAYVYFLNGRLTFVGETSPYPKDCMLCVFGGGGRFPGYKVWGWGRS